jgi:hypothetical protein
MGEEAIRMGSRAGGGVPICEGLHCQNSMTGADPKKQYHIVAAARLRRIGGFIFQLDGNRGNRSDTGVMMTATTMITGADSFLELLKVST